MQTDRINYMAPSRRTAAELRAERAEFDRQFAARQRAQEKARDEQMRREGLERAAEREANSRLVFARGV